MSRMHSLHGKLAQSLQRANVVGAVSARDFIEQVAVVDHIARKQNAGVLFEQRDAAG